MPVEGRSRTRSNITRALDGLEVTIVENPDWEQGMGTSIHAGIRAAEDLDCAAAILTLADQPFVTATKLNELILEHALNGHGIVTAEYADTVGVPVLFSDEYFGHLLALAPDQGCKGVIMKNAPAACRVPTPEAELDVDYSGRLSEAGCDAGLRLTSGSTLFHSP